VCLGCKAKNAYKLKKKFAQKNLVTLALKKSSKVDLKELSKYDDLQHQERTKKTRQIKLKLTYVHQQSAL